MTTRHSSPLTGRGATVAGRFVQYDQAATGLTRETRMSGASRRPADDGRGSAPVLPADPSPDAGDRPSGASPEGRPPRPAASPSERMPSLPFLWWAIGLAVTAGFGLGMSIFFSVALGLPIHFLWFAAVQAHVLV